MAGLHNELQRDVGLLAAYQAALGEKSERFIGLERGGETLTPIIDLWSRPEWQLLRGEVPGAQALFVPAVAAEFGWAALVNPTGLRLLVVCEAISATGATAGQFAIIHALASSLSGSLDVSAAGHRRDRRFSASPFETRALVQRGGAAGTISGDELEVLRNVASETVPAGIAVPVTLQPGHAIVLQQSTANVSFTGNFKWRERVPLPGEL